MLVPSTNAASAASRRDFARRRSCLLATGESGRNRGALRRISARAARQARHARENVSRDALHLPLTSLRGARFGVPIGQKFKFCLARSTFRRARARLAGFADVVSAMDSCKLELPKQSIAHLRDTQSHAQTQHAARTAPHQNRPLGDAKRCIDSERRPRMAAERIPKKERRRKCRTTTVERIASIVNAWRSAVGER